MQKQTNYSYKCMQLIHLLRNNKRFNSFFTHDNEPHTNTSLKPNLISKSVFFQLFYTAQFSHLPLGCTRLSREHEDHYRIAVWDMVSSDTHGDCSDRSLCCDSDREEATSADPT